MTAGAQIDLFAEPGDAVEVEAGAERGAAERLRQRVVERQRLAHRLIFGIDHQNRGALAFAGRQRRTQDHAGGVAGEKDATFKLFQSYPAPAYERLNQTVDAMAHRFRHVLEFDALDEAVDDREF